ncbi:MAG TPA: ABC transporter permease [Chitinophagaceae bacterium]|nr:ABC transporter permease [Chitinophagaceae bacterium]
MIKNYFKIALRSLWKNKTASFINIAGLSVGLTCCLLMVLYMQHELSYDKFQQKGDRVVRVIMEYSFNGSPLTKGNFTSTKVFPSFKQNFPEVEDGARMSGTARLVKYGDKIFTEKQFLYADSTFFRIFSFNLLKGDPALLLKAPKMVVISQSAAKKYFGDDDPIGRILQVSSNQDNYTVTGIAEDCPSNSQIKFDFLASFSSLGQTQEETYYNANFTTYLLLKDKSSIVSLQKKIGPFMKKEMSGEQGAYVNYQLEPYTRVHLYSPYDGFEANSNITYIYIIAGIALLVLIIACFTYINLSTARSMERAKEVGIRKVSGAFRLQIFWQFICESFFLVTAALLLSFVLIAVVLPSFNQLAGKSLHIADMAKTSMLTTALLIAAVIALLAGSYPALILSKFQPITVLKGIFKNTSSGVWLRRSLIVFQFVISVILVTATIIIKGQMHYIQNKKLGYDKDHVIVMNIDQKIIEKIDLFKSELKNNGEILAVSKANNSPVSILGGYSMNRADMSSGQAINTRGNPIDDEYIKANGLQIIAGNDLSKQDVLDADKEDYSKNYYHYIINESAAKALGWQPGEAIGKKMFLGEQRPGEVKAVVKDFHFASLHNTIEPLVLFPGWGSNLIVKMSGKNLAQTIAFIGNKWKQLAPHRPFEYRFMDDDFNKLYDSETRTAKVFNIFSAIAILLACLGLFGLSAYSARQRIKEIGIRKVLGASAGSITLLLSNSFIKLVFIAFVIACPVAWFVMNKWLQDFAYRINISWWMFGLAGLLALVIAIITVSFQAIKAAIANPVKSLRTE